MMPTPPKTATKRPAKRKPAAKKAAGLVAPGTLEQSLSRLQEQISLASIYVDSQGREVSMPVINQKKNQGQLAGYGQDEQLRIREQLATYKRLQGQAGHIKRQLNKVVGADGKVQHVLDTHRGQLLEWFARHYDVREVHRRCIVDLELDVSYEVLRKWQARNIESIKQGQFAARQDITDLPFVHKRVRLQELHDHYLQAKQLYDQTKRVPDRDACLRIMELIRKEVEGDVLNVHGKIDIEANITVTVEQRLQADLVKQLPMQALILAKVAAARGLDPTWLLTRLQQSYYNRFNGWVSGQQSANGPSDDFVFPSERGYDYNQIEQLHRQQQQTGQGQPQQLAAPTTLSAEQANDVQQARAQALRRLGLA